MSRRFELSDDEIINRFKSLYDQFDSLDRFCSHLRLDLHSLIESIGDLRSRVEKLEKKKDE